MILPAEIIAITRAGRHCTEHGCRKCIARARWRRRKQWRTRKKPTHRKTGRK